MLLPLCVALAVAQVPAVAPAKTYDLSWRPKTGDQAVYRVQMNLPVGGDDEATVVGTLSLDLRYSDGANWAAKVSADNGTLTHQDEAHDIPAVTGWFHSYGVREESKKVLGFFAELSELFTLRISDDPVKLGQKWMYELNKELTGDYEVLAVERVGGTEALKVREIQKHEGKLRPENFYWISTADGALVRARVNIYVQVNEEQETVGLASLERLQSQPRPLQVIDPQHLSLYGRVKDEHFKASQGLLEEEKQRDISKYNVAFEESETEWIIRLTPKNQLELSSAKLPNGPTVRFHFSRNGLSLESVAVGKD